MEGFIAVGTNNTMSIWYPMSYDLMTEYLEGYLEFVSLSKECCVYVNETGKLDGLPVNRIATYIARMINPQFSDVIVGNAIFCGPADDDGEDTPLGKSMIENMIEMYNSEFYKNGDN